MRGAYLSSCCSHRGKHAKEKKTKSPKGPRHRRNMSASQVSTTYLDDDAYFDGVRHDLDDINEIMRDTVNGNLNLIDIEDDSKFAQLNDMCNRQDLRGDVKAYAIFARSFRLMSFAGE